VYYALWTDRHGRHHWSGPHTSAEAADIALTAIIDCQSPMVVRKMRTPRVRVVAGGTS